ncbi:TPA_asm: hypothetical protein G4D26_000575 [Salmonella enterica subsp. enterica serovar 4,[5],12:b:-]|nr:hypothetical protein [Salmonella enterica subsp. enterica serovar 4,[5],12:b:-]EKC4779491.1 hypothetical protein [Salmonella enterica]HAE4644366.1 hypothetical protein [Salmonella enterica subsp. enterica serovar 4,[5],12:b:-]
MKKLKTGSLTGILNLLFFVVRKIDVVVVDGIEVNTLHIHNDQASESRG